MNKRIKILLVLMLILAMVGCSSGKSSDEASSSSSVNKGELLLDYAGGNSVYPEEPAMDRDMAAEESMDGMGSGGYSGGQIEPDKIITTVSVELESIEFDKTLQSLNGLVLENDGYISSSNIYHGNYNPYEDMKYRNANLTIRIPRENIEQFKSQVPTVASMVTEGISKDDVTKHYTDTESRLAVLEVKEERLLSLLDRADKMEDIIALESELSNVIQEKESLRTTLVDLDDRIDYSTFHINIREVREITPQETVETTFGSKIKNAVIQSWSNLKNDTEGFIIGLVYVLPGLIIVLLVLIFGWKLSRKYIAPKLFSKAFKDKDWKKEKE